MLTEAKCRPCSDDKLAGRLVTVLERYRDGWDPKELARQLRKFADSLDSQKGGKKARKK